MAPYTGNPYDVLPELESLGETEVCRRLPTGEFGEEDSILRSVVENWLASQESVRKAAAEARSETREEAMLSTAREANSIALKARSEARRANIIAIIAMILSTITAIIATSDKFILVLQWLGVLKP